MKVQEMSGSVEKFFGDANTLQWRKNADYHPDGVAMLEILRTAWETNVTVEQDLWGKIRKQMSALRRFVIEGHLESEPPRSRMIDVAVYMGMLAFWTENKQMCVTDALRFVHREVRCERYGGIQGAETCTTHGVSIQDACDRCNFLHWLMNYRAN